jgi:hypothetical protein
VCATQIDAGGRTKCCEDLKEHERRASVGYSLRYTYSTYALVSLCTCVTVH